MDLRGRAMSRRLGYATVVGCSDAGISFSKITHLVTVSCTGCAKSLTVKDEFIGKRLKCPQCGATFTATAAQARSPGKQTKDAPKVTISPGVIAFVAIVVLWQMRREPRPLPDAMVAQRVQAWVGIVLALIGIVIFYAVAARRAGPVYLCYVGARHRVR